MAGRTTMGLRINTNIASMTAQRHLGAATNRVNASMERLSTGRRIVRAGDDPAGLAMSERLRAQISGIDVALRNVQDGISLLQIQDGSMSQIGEALVRARELAVQAANGTLSPGDRSALQLEFAEIQELVDLLSAGASFNGIALLSGATSTVTLQVGPNTNAATDTYDITVAALSTSTLGIGSLSIATASGATLAMDALDGAIDLVSARRGQAGAGLSALDVRTSSLQVLRENLSAANSRIMDVDYAKETAVLVQAQITQRMAMAMLVQANQQPEMVLRLLESIPRFG